MIIGAKYERGGPDEWVVGFLDSCLNWIEGTGRKAVCKWLVCLRR